MVRKQKHRKQNPIVNANIFSRICYWWLAPIWYKGASRDLEMIDLYEPMNSERSEMLGDQLEREWDKEFIKIEACQVESGKLSKLHKPSLLRCIVRIYSRTYTICGFFTFVQNIVCYNFRTIFFGWLINYFDTGTTVSKFEAYCYAAGIVVTTIIAVIINNAVHFQTARIGMKIRVACSSLIYRKTLKLSKTSLDQTSAGQIINLLSNDVQRFDFFPIHLHYAWIAPIQILLTSYLVYQEVGLAVFAGLTVMLLQTIPVQGYMSKLSIELRKKVAEQTDKRLQLMNELISGIRVVKMYGWEKPFEKMINGVRAVEMKLISLSCFCRSYYTNGLVFSERVTIFVTLVTLVLSEADISAKMLFTVIAYWKTSHVLMAILIPFACVNAGDAHVAFTRIQEYLLLNELKTESKDSLSNINLSKNETGITISKLSASWVYGALPPTLCNLNLEVDHGQLCALVGPVGSGKSSLLQLILGELPATCGTVDIEGQSISYAAQEPWLFGGTIRDNILFGLPYTKSKYDEVTRVCALREDFEQLPMGHLTLVGDRGLTLSGGQRARINLARAVYRDADIYLLDDPLSAVDPRVGKQLFNECIREYLRGKTRILVTHQLQYLQNVDTIAVLKDGHLESLRHGDPDFANLTNSLHVAEAKSEQDFQTLSSKTQLDRSIVSIAESFASEPEILNGEKITKGRIPFKVYANYFESCGSICLCGSVLLMIMLSQLTTSGSDYWVASWTKREMLKNNVNRTSYYSNFSRSDDEMAETSALNISGLSNLQNDGIFFTPTISIAIYSGIISTCVLFTLVRSILFIRLSVNSSKNLHNRMLETVSRATLGFFATNPSGRILNRFSKDVGAVDELLPQSMVEVITVFCMLLGSLIMISVGNYFMVILAVMFGGICYMLRNSYLSIAHCVNRLQSVAKSPMLSHVNYSLDGLLTVRSSQAQQRMIKEFDDLQNVHVSASFVNIATTLAFSFYINTLVTFLITAICFIFILLDDEGTMSGDVGLAISQAIGLVEMVQFGIIKSVQLVSEMTSTERVLEYTKLLKEGPFESSDNNKPSPRWPQFGTISIQNLSLRYDEEKPAVLKNVNLNINHGEKIGIVGRTGAGKSSLIAALFRLGKIEGSIRIDGVDIQAIGLHDLRSKISIIPQEPSLFKATLRHNLDPFNEFTDDYLWSTLDEVELKESFTSLDYEVSQGGGNLSLGERQLICLARAILRNNKIVILDEATANVDSRTDSLVQATIRRKFADRTVVTIAHRLSTIMDSDQVVILDNGRVVEFGQPRYLLKNPDGFFTRMVNASDSTVSEEWTRTTKL